MSETRDWFVELGENRERITSRLQEEDLDRIKGKVLRKLREKKRKKKGSTFDKEVRMIRKS